MSIEKMTTVLYHAEVSGNEKIVLLGIANHEGDGGAYPAVDTLARYANIDRRATQRILRKLEEASLLSSARRTGASTVYRVLVQCPENWDRTTHHRLLKGGGYTTTGVFPTTGGAVTEPRGGAVAQPPEPSYNRQINLIAFNQFWANYPRKYASHNAKAEFAKLTDEEQQTAITKAAEFAMSEEAENPKYTPYPTTWLKTKRFNDEYTPSDMLRLKQQEATRKESLIAEAMKPKPEIIRTPVPKCLVDTNVSIVRCGHADCVAHYEKEGN